MTWSHQTSWPPSRGIWWPREVLHKVILTFWRMQLRMYWYTVSSKFQIRCTPPIVPTGDQEQHEVRSYWYWLCVWVMMTFSSCTEHYYTNWVWHVEVFRCTEGRCTLPSIEPSATKLYYTRSVWHVVECRCTPVRCTPHPLVIKPGSTEHYYTRWVWHVEVFRCTEVRCTPPSIEPSATELYYTRSVWHVAECRCTPVRCTPHP